MPRPLVTSCAVAQRGMPKNGVLSGRGKCALNYSVTLKSAHHGAGRGLARQRASGMDPWGYKSRFQCEHVISRVSKVFQMFYAVHAQFHGAFHSSGHEHSLRYLSNCHHHDQDTKTVEPKGPRDPNIVFREMLTQSNIGQSHNDSQKSR